MGAMWSTKFSLNADRKRRKLYMRQDGTRRLVPDAVKLYTMEEALKEYMTGGLTLQ